MLFSPGATATTLAAMFDLPTLPPLAPHYSDHIILLSEGLPRTQRRLDVPGRRPSLGHAGKSTGRR